MLQINWFLSSGNKCRFKQVFHLRIGKTEIPFVCIGLKILPLWDMFYAMNHNLLKSIKI